MNKFVKLLLDLLFPPKCAVCGELTEDKGALCAECLSKYREESGSGTPSAKNFDGTLRMIVITTYDPSRADTHVTERMILKLKKVKREALADVFARDMALALLKDIKLSGIKAEDTVLTYIPRSGKNLAKYGFDHGELLCRRISKYSGVEMLSVLERRHGREQKKMNAKERMANAEESIILSDETAVKDRHVYLVDDIITTGAGAKRSATLLYKAGCRDVTGLFIAETVRRDRSVSY